MYKVFEIGTDPFALETRLNDLEHDGYQLKSTLEGHPGQYSATGVYMDHTWSPSMLIVYKPSDPVDPVAAILTAISRLTDKELLLLIDGLPEDVTDPICAKCDDPLQGEDMPTGNNDDADYIPF